MPNLHSSMKSWGERVKEDLAKLDIQALGREFKQINPACRYWGIDIEPTYVELAKRYCDTVGVLHFPYPRP